VDRLRPLPMVPEGKKGMNSPSASWMSPSPEARKERKEFGSGAPGNSFLSFPSLPAMRQRGGRGSPPLGSVKTIADAFAPSFAITLAAWSCQSSIGGVHLPAHASARAKMLASLSPLARWAPTSRSNTGLRPSPPRSRATLPGWVVRSSDGLTTHGSASGAGVPGRVAAVPPPFPWPSAPQPRPGFGDGRLPRPHLPGVGTSLMLRDGALGSGDYHIPPDGSAVDPRCDALAVRVPAGHRK
jgi:hypothetical protein